MDYKDKIIMWLAEISSKNITNKVIRKLQNMTEDLLSGDDTILKNIWDEVCVQVQYEESYMWEIYELTIKLLVKDEIQNLSIYARQAIWLQTDEGSEWEIDNENLQICNFYEEDIEEYIIKEYILPAAADWTNKRIEKFLEREYD